MEIEPSIKTFYALLIIFLPLIMYITGIATVTGVNEKWFNDTKFAHMPQLMYTRLGLLLGAIFNLLLGVGLQNLHHHRGEDTNVESTTIAEYILYYSFPIMMLLYAIAYPLMCQYQSHDLGAGLTIVPGVFMIAFGLYTIKWIKTAMLTTITVTSFGFVLVYNAITLFMSRPKVKNEKTVDDVKRAMTRSTIPNTYK